MWEGRYDAAQQYWYYYNTVSGEATWNRPSDYVSRLSDFEEKFDEQTGRHYYYDKLTQESSWEVPACWRVGGEHAAPPPPHPPTPPPAAKKQPKPTSTCSMLARGGGRTLVSRGSALRRGAQAQCSRPDSAGPTTTTTREISLITTPRRRLKRSRKIGKLR